MGYNGQPEPEPTPQSIIYAAPSDRVREEAPAPVLDEDDDHIWSDDAEDEERALNVWVIGRWR